MSATIWKFPLEITDRQIIGPVARVLSVGLDPAGVLCIWAEVIPDDTAGQGEAEVVIVGTGNPLPFWKGSFVGSVTMAPFVWHVYVVGPPVAGAA
jgi:hypothetical protein